MKSRSIKSSMELDAVVGKVSVHGCQRYYEKASLPEEKWVYSPPAFCEAEI